MSSFAFQKALKATGYLMPDGSAAPGLVFAGGGDDSRVRSVLSEGRAGLHADAVFSAQKTPATIFKDAGCEQPTNDQIVRWHEAAWNMGVAPLLWIVTPTDIRLYDCYASPPSENKAQQVAPPLGVFPLDAQERLQALDAMCGRYATETGAFWSSAIGKNIDRRHRVDRALLAEIKALEERLTRLPPADGAPLHDDHEENQAARDFAQRLVGRCIFTSYLLDRHIAQPFLPPGMAGNVTEMFSSVESAFDLFQWLRATFNGDLFPMDDPGAEHHRLGEDHLALLRDFTNGYSLVSGQRRLFQFRYDAIPVDLISSIYQQFARSSAGDAADDQGLHYTPVELVHLTLDPVFETLPATARVIDPTCGSGAFLVEAFRRLVWRGAGGKPANRALVREVLYQRLYGIDINKSALGIAAFSLYLAALELDEEPITDITDLKFHRLIGTTLFEADTLQDELPEAITESPFDAVVGNPPWTFVCQSKPKAKRKPGAEETTRPRRSPDQEFLRVGARLAGDKGRIGMIMKASPFFSKDQHAIAAREVLLRRLAPVAIVNLSALRKEGLFPDATGPALLFFSRCALVEQDDRLLVGSIPWTPDFKRNGIFHVGPGEFRSLPLKRVLRTPAMLKAATFGTIRDGWLIERLERSFPSLDQLLDSVRLLRLETRGQGFKVKGDVLYSPPDEYSKLHVLTAEKFTPFRINVETLELFTHETLHRTRSLGIFKGPLLICPKGSFDHGAEPGRYSAAVSAKDVLYTQSFYGISFAEHYPEWANVITAILNSSLTTFQLAFGGSTWGLERPTVEPNDLLSIRVPDLACVDSESLDAVVQAERQAAKDPHNLELLDALDQAVFELYGLERDETVVARESVVRARMLLVEARAQRLAFVKAPDAEVLFAYAGELVRVVNAYLRARGKRHLEAVIYPCRLTSGNVTDGVPGITAVKFVMVTGVPPDKPSVRVGARSEIEHLSKVIHGQVNKDVPPYLNERRQLRIYGEKELFVLKPSEVRYWSRTAGLNDADVILADHWMKGSRAVAA
jgi:hypothetical protein